MGLLKCGPSGPMDFEREINSRGVAHLKVVIFWLTVLEVIYFELNLRLSCKRYFLM